MYFFGICHNTYFHNYSEVGEHIHTKRLDTYATLLFGLSINAKLQPLAEKHFSEIYGLRQTIWSTISVKNSTTYVIIARIRCPYS